MEKVEEWSDAFGKLVTKGTRNTLDLPAYHSFSEERYRYIENGSRITHPDSDSTRFTDGEKTFNIAPEAGDTIELKTAERPRYIVGNDVAVSWSFKFVSDLVDANDQFTLFVEDTFELRYFGDGSIKLVSFLNGGESETRDVEVPKGTDTPTRPELKFNWYAVGRLSVTIEYTDQDQQRTSEEVVLTNDDDWLSDNPTQRIGWRIEASNSGIELECGSLAYIPQTDSPPTARNKPMLFSSGELNEIAADGYTVVGALRIDPNRDDVYTTITSVDVTAEASVDVELMLKAVHSANTDADFLDPDNDGTDEGPAYPRANSPQNNVIQWTPNVSTFPTRTYAVTGETVPSGRLVGLSGESSAGTGAGITKTGIARAANRPIYPDDIVLMIGHTPDVSTATNVDVFLGTDQDW